MPGDVVDHRVEGIEESDRDALNEVSFRAGLFPFVAIPRRFLMGFCFGVCKRTRQDSTGEFALMVASLQADHIPQVAFDRDRRRGHCSTLPNVTVWGTHSQGAACGTMRQRFRLEDGAELSYEITVGHIIAEPRYDWLSGSFDQRNTPSRSYPAWSSSSTDDFTPQRADPARRYGTT